MAIERSMIHIGGHRYCALAARWILAPGQWVLSADGMNGSRIASYDDRPAKVLMHARALKIWGEVTACPNCYSGAQHGE